MNSEDTLFLSLAISCNLLSPVEAEEVRRRLCEETCKSTAKQIMVDAGFISQQSADALQQIRAELMTRNQSRATILPEPSSDPTIFFDRPQHATSDSHTNSETRVNEAVWTENRFVRMARLASGGLGVIYLAADRQLDREVAIKTLLPVNRSNQEAVDRFIREARITGKLEHPGIVPIYAVGRDLDNDYFYAMKFIQGTPLKIAIENFHKHVLSRRYSSPEFRDLLNKFISVCNAIEFAHKNGIVHRDIKPANIMLGNFGETLVVDWGLAKEIRSRERGSDTFEGAHSDASNTVEGTVLGTPLYAAPEQLLGNIHSIRESVDVYALGATLYEILVGQPKFAGMSFKEIKEAAVSGQFNSIKKSSTKVPRVLCAICDKAMANDASHRYFTVAELRQDLERWLNDLPVLIFKEGVLQKLSRFVRNHPVFMLSLVSILFMLALAVPINIYIGNPDYQLGDLLPPLLYCIYITALVQLINYLQRKLQWYRNHPSASVGLAIALAAFITSITVYALHRLSDEGLVEYNHRAWVISALVGSALMGWVAFLCSRLWYASRKRP